MKNFALLTFITFTSIIGVSQSYTAFDGSTFSVGDSICIGFQSGNSSYVYIRDFQGGNYYGLNINLALNKYVIKGIFPNSERYGFSGRPTVLQVGTRGLRGISFYISLDDAIRHGEVVVEQNPHKKSTNRLEDIKAFIFLTQGENIDRYIDEYLFRFHNELYARTRNNEFEYHTSKAMAKQEILEVWNSFDYSQTFSYSTRINLENYCFENQGFPFALKTLTLNILRRQLTLNNITNEISINFINFSDFPFVFINPEKANSFIKRRTDHRGSVDRRIYAVVYFNLVKIEDIDTEQGYVIYGNISEIEIYDHQNLRYNWLATLTPSTTVDYE